MQVTFLGKCGDCNIDRSIGALHCHLLMPHFGLYETNDESNFCKKTQYLLNWMTYTLRKLT
jgi:hypothetical protein